MSYTIELSRRRWLTQSIFELEFTNPDGLEFLPGQHIRFFFDGIDRDYTPVSLSNETTIKICVKKVDQPRLSDHFSRCPEGETFKIEGPFGHFLHQTANALDIFIGTGTGVAPFAAFACAGVKNFTLLQGARSPDELIYRELFESSSSEFIPCFSQSSDGAPGYHGRVTDYLNEKLIPGTYQFYLSGQREMILDALDIIDEKFTDSKVFTERFT